MSAVPKAGVDASSRVAVKARNRKVILPEDNGLLSEGAGLVAYRQDAAGMHVRKREAATSFSASARSPYQSAEFHPSAPMERSSDVWCNFWVCLIYILFLMYCTSILVSCAFAIGAIIAIKRPYGERFSMQ